MNVYRFLDPFVDSKLNERICKKVGLQNWKLFDNNRLRGMNGQDALRVISWLHVYYSGRVINSFKILLIHHKWQKEKVEKQFAGVCKRESNDFSLDLG